MTTGAKVVAGIAAVGLAVAVATGVSNRSTRPAESDVQPRLTPVTPELATKAREHCWFNVKSHYTKTNATRDWGGLSSSGVATERLGDLLIVTGGIEPAVGDERFFGCSLFEYTEGSPVVMTTKTSPTPLRADLLVPLGFTSGGQKQ
jgi:hypothetical protein